jgi:hypothetical protein
MLAGFNKQVMSTFTGRATAGQAARNVRQPEGRGGVDRGDGRPAGRSAGVKSQRRLPLAENVLKTILRIRARKT